MKILNIFFAFAMPLCRKVCISHATAAAAATLFLCNIPDILHALSRHMPLQKSVHCLSQKQGRLFMTYSPVPKLTLSRLNWQHEVHYLVKACFIQRILKILCKLNACSNFITWDYLFKRQNKVHVTVLAFLYWQLHVSSYPPIKICSHVFSLLGQISTLLQDKQSSLKLFNPETNPVP